jgi:hypothetical protein
LAILIAAADVTVVDFIGSSIESGGASRRQAPPQVGDDLLAFETCVVSPSASSPINTKRAGVSQPD